MLAAARLLTMDRQRTPELTAARRIYRELQTIQSLVVPQHSRWPTCFDARKKGMHDAGQSDFGRPGFRCCLSDSSRAWAGKTFTRKCHRCSLDPGGSIN